MRNSKVKKLRRQFISDYKGKFGTYVIDVPPSPRNIHSKGLTKQQMSLNPCHNAWRKVKRVS